MNEEEEDVKIEGNPITPPLQSVIQPCVGDPQDVSAKPCLGRYKEIMEEEGNLDLI